MGNGFRVCSDLQLSGHHLKSPLDGHFLPGYAHDNRYYNGDLDGSNDGCNEDVRELLPTWYHVENTEVRLLTVLTSVARFAPARGEVIPVRITFSIQHLLFIENVTHAYDVAGSGSSSPVNF